MEKSAELVLVLLLLLSALSAAPSEGRAAPTLEQPEPKAKHPENFIGGFGGGVIPPGLVGSAPGILGGGSVFGPLFPGVQFAPPFPGGLPGVLNVPVAPGGGLGGGIGGIGGVGQP